MFAIPTAVHIALLDNHPLFRQELSAFLKSVPYVANVTEATDFQTVVACCRQGLPDILLLDMQMPDKAGAEVARELLAEFPELKIIVLSMFSADKFIIQMMRLGARSYVPKDVYRSELIETIEEVLTGGHHFTPRISRALLSSSQQLNLRK